MSLESQLQAALLLAAPRLLPDLRLFRRNVGVARFGKRKVTFGVAGQCDLWGICRGGRHIEIELKTATGRLSDEQFAWQAWCIEWSIAHVVLRAGKDESTETTIARWCDELGRLR